MHINKYCTFCDSYVRRNTYTITFCAVYYRLLVHILDNRWSSNNFVNKEWELFKLIFVYSNTITHFYFMPDIDVKKQDYSRCEHWKNFILFIWKKIYKLTLLAVSPASQTVWLIFNFWKSKLYINAKGRLFWNLKKIFSLRNLNRHISTFDIVTILIRRYRYIYWDYLFLMCVVLKIFASGADCGLEFDFNALYVD